MGSGLPAAIAKLVNPDKQVARLSVTEGSRWCSGSYDRHRYGFDITVVVLNNETNIIYYASINTSIFFILKSLFKLNEIDAFKSSHFSRAEVKLSPLTTQVV
ncbi:hypothetical protein [Bhargavaea cecembensis]|uniref:hypothetical protein n=1 Tax=Bhargavaea cecembensis TaxID=394098 RepID=UPI002E0E025D